MGDVVTNDQMEKLVWRLAQTIRVHCKAQRTRVLVSEAWVMDLARNQVAAASSLIDEFLVEAAEEAKDPDLLHKKFYGW